MTRFIPLLAVGAHPLSSAFQEADIQRSRSEARRHVAREASRCSTARSLYRMVGRLTALVTSTRLGCEVFFILLNAIGNHRPFLR